MSTDLSGGPWGISHPATTINREVMFPPISNRAGLV